MYHRNKITEDWIYNSVLERLEIAIQKKIIIEHENRQYEQVQYLNTLLKPTRVIRSQVS